MSDLQIFIPLVKVDEEHRLVYGIATAEERDKSGEICDYATTKPQYEAWSSEFQKATDGKSHGALRVMHDRKIAAGLIKNVTFDDVGKKVLISAEVVDDQEWKKVLKGVYTGFSQGGSYLKRWKDPDDDTSWRYTAKPSEISLVDTPCLGSARFEIVKADGSVELRKFEGSASATEDVTDEQIVKAAELVDTVVGLLKSIDPTVSDEEAETIVGEELIAKWDEDRHPRDSRGEFAAAATAGGAVAGAVGGAVAGAKLGAKYGAHVGRAVGAAAAGLASQGNKFKANADIMRGARQGYEVGGVKGAAVGAAAGVLAGGLAGAAIAHGTGKAVTAARSAVSRYQQRRLAAKMEELDSLGKWDEDRHPRDGHGRFSSGGGDAGRSVGGSVGSSIGRHYGSAVGGHVGAAAGRATGIGEEHGRVIGDTVGGAIGSHIGEHVGTAAGVITGSAVGRAAETAQSSVMSAAHAAGEGAAIAARSIVGAAEYLGNQVYTRGRNTLRGAAAGAIEGVSRDMPWIQSAALAGGARGGIAGAVAGGPIGAASGAAMGAARGAITEGVEAAAYGGISGAIAGATQDTVDDSKLSDRVSTAVGYGQDARLAVTGLRLASNFIMNTGARQTAARAARAAGSAASRAAGAVKDTVNSVRYPGFKGTYTGGGSYRSTMEMAERVSPSLLELQKFGMSTEDIVGLVDWLTHEETVMKSVSEITAADVARRATEIAKAAGDEATWILKIEEARTQLLKEAGGDVDLPLAKHKYSDDERKKMAQSGQAKGDGSFPIKDREDVQNAVSDWGRAGATDSDRDHIVARARAVGATDELPSDWPGSSKKDARTSTAAKTDGATDLVKSVLERSLALSGEKPPEVDLKDRLRKFLSSSDWDSQRAMDALMILREVVMRELSEPEQNQSQIDSLQQSYDGLREFIASEIQEGQSGDCTMDEAEKMAGRLDTLSKMDTIDQESLAKIQEIHDVCIKLGCSCQSKNNTESTAKFEATGDLQKIEEQRDSLLKAFEVLGPRLDKISARLAEQDEELKKLRSTAAPRPQLRVVEKGHDVVFDRGGAVETSIQAEFEKLTPEEKGQLMVRLAQSQPKTYGVSR